MLEGLLSSFESEEEGHILTEQELKEKQKISLIYARLNNMKRLYAPRRLGILGEPMVIGVQSIFTS